MAVVVQVVSASKVEVLRLQSVRSSQQSRHTIVRFYRSPVYIGIEKRGYVIVMKMKLKRSGVRKMKFRHSFKTEYDRARHIGDRLTSLRASKLSPTFSKLVIPSLVQFSSSDEEQIDSSFQPIEPYYPILIECLGKMSLECPFLTRLVLSSMQLKDEMMTLISKSNWQFLRVLNVSQNYITQSGVRTLVQVNYKYLEELDISSNHVNNKGVKWLARAKWPSLIQLVLSQNYALSPDCFKYLQKMSFPRLSWIYTDCCSQSLRHRVRVHLANCFPTNYFEYFKYSKVKQINYVLQSKNRHLMKAEWSYSYLVSPEFERQKSEHPELELDTKQTLRAIHFLWSIDFE